MIDNRIKLKTLVTAILLSAFVPFFIQSTAHAASFDPTRIIDDGVFYNTTSMTTAQIQAFLNSKVPTCDTNGTMGSTSTSRANATRSAGYGLPLVCLKDYYENPSTHENNLTKVDGQAVAIPAGAQSAAQIIATASTYYGINPQVLIVLLQKEQGLVTDAWPWPSEFKTATGFGCPDTAACASQYFGFYNQVNLAARQFRLYANNPASYNFVPGPGNFVKYNPNASCGGTTLTIQSQATASLYDYTPYQPNAVALAAGYGTGDGCSAYGNRNFWLYFNDWFGSTLFPQPVGGSLLFQSSNGKLFLVTEGARYYIPSWSVMTNYGLNVFPVQAASDTTVAQYTDGGTLTNLSWDSGAVYLVNNRVRYHVSTAMCTAWGLSCSDNTVVKPLGAQFQTQFLLPGSELTQLAGANGTIYEMSGGKRLPIANPKTLSDLGLATTAVLATSETNSNQPLGPPLITTPGIATFAQNPAIYYFDGTSYFTVGDMNVYNDWALSGVVPLSIPASSYSGATTPPSSSLTSWYQDSSGQKYIIDQGSKLSVPASLQTTWSGVNFTAGPGALFNRLTATPLYSNIWASSAVYVLAGGMKHYVPTSDDMSALGLNSSNMTNLRTDKLNVVPSGNDALGDGKVLGLQGSNSLYVINMGKLLHITDPNVFTAYGYNWSNIASYPQSLATDYQYANTDLANSITPDSRYLIANGTQLLQLSQSLAADFGLKTTSFTPITALVSQNTRPSTMSRFLYNSDNGKIYYASGGAIHYVSTYAAFVAYGGTKIPATAVNSAIISLFIEAQPI